MRLYTRCSTCRAFINFSAMVNDRFKLAAKFGEKVPLKCKDCNTNGKYHVNDIKAEVNKKVSLLAGIIFLFGTLSLVAALWGYLTRLNSAYTIAGFMGVFTIPFMMYQAINHEQESKVRYFNDYHYG